MKSIRELKEKPQSSFKNRLHEAIKLGQDWESRDIRYYYWNKDLEKEKQEKIDQEEIKRAKKVHFDQDELRQAKRVTLDEMWEVSKKPYTSVVMRDIVCEANKIGRAHV